MNNHTKKIYWFVALSVTEITEALTGFDYFYSGNINQCCRWYFSLKWQFARNESLSIDGYYV